jgi:hypothetical protein
MLIRKIVASLLLVMVSAVPVAASKVFDEKDDLENLAAAIEGPASPRAPEVVSRDSDGRVTLRAVRLDDPVTVDGRLEENLYRSVPAISDFVQQEPIEGAPATEQTDVWVFYDERNVYVSARCWHSEPDRIVANELRRDNRNISSNDNFAVIFDTFYDRRNGFLFHTNPVGALYDAQVTDERNVNSDWNTVWEVKTARFADGWTVEMVIPFKSLRYKVGRSQLWGINFRRIVRSANEMSYLTPIPAVFRQGGLTKLSHAGTLVGIETPVNSVNLELKPFGTAGLRTDLDTDVHFEKYFNSAVGFDAKYGVTKSIVADFTVHTDFAQVEADEEQVNLTRFNLFFPEKRDFFLEGQGIFAFGGAGNRRWRGGNDTPIMFFSRRIGLQEEHQVPIQAGGRLTGRAGAYTIGLLNIQTGGSEAVAETPIDPTNFSVVRIKRDLLRRSSIGVIATHRNRSVETLGGSNSLFGLDAGFRFYDNLNVDAYYAKTFTDELEGPDDSYLARVRYGSDLFGFSAEHLKVGEDFNPEIGFLRRTDVRKSAGELSYSPRPRSIAAIRKFTFEGEAAYYENGAGQVETRELQASFRTQLSSGDWFDVEYQRQFEHLYEEFEISDGILLPAGGYDFDRIEGSYRFGPQRRMSGWFRASTGKFYSGTRTEVGYSGRMELIPQLSIEPNVSQNWVDLVEGSFTTTLLRFRATYALSARSFVGALMQYNTSSSSFLTNVRFRWEYQPGSDVFLVYTDGRDTSSLGSRDYASLRNQSLVFKITRLFRF